MPFEIKINQLFPYKIALTMANFCNRQGFRLSKGYIEVDRKRNKKATLETAPNLVWIE